MKMCSDILHRLDNLRSSLIDYTESTKSLGKKLVLTMEIPRLELLYFAYNSMITLLKTFFLKNY